MRHLTDLELLALLENPSADNGVSAVRIDHLQSCDSCRRALGDLREARDRAADVRLPEPSPLFWEHFSRRVREGIRNTEISRPRWYSAWLQAPGFKWGFSGALVVVLLGAAAWLTSLPAPAPDEKSPAGAARVAGTDSVSSAMDADSIDADSNDLESDEAWALVRTVADDLEWDDVATASLAARPGWAERAALDLTREERAELLRLLQVEARRPGA
jgi:hypothetical protein